ADLWAIRGRRIGGASLQGRSYINSRGMWVIEASESFDDAFRRADPNTSTVTSASSSSASTTLPTTSTTALLRPALSPPLPPRFSVPLCLWDEALRLPPRRAG